MSFYKILLAITILGVFFPISVNAASACKVDWTFQPSLLSFKQSYYAFDGETVFSRAKKDLRRARNVGNHDVKILLQGGFSAEKWELLNLGEEKWFAGEARAIKCLGTKTGKRDLLARLAEQIGNVTAGTAETVAKEVKKATRKIEGEYNKLKKEVQNNIKNERLKKQQERDKFFSTGMLEQCSGAVDYPNIGVERFEHLEITGEYSKMNAYLLAHASMKTGHNQMKYKGNKIVREGQFRCAARAVYEKWGFNDVYFIDTKAGANAVVAVNESVVVIAFRGTQAAFGKSEAGAADVADVIVNMGIIHAKDMYDNEVHAGYYTAAHSAVNRISTILNQHNALTSKKIYITGHSLGGATATLTAYYLKKMNYPVEAAYVYAPPKVGNQAFTAELKRSLNLYAFENYRDPVTLIPSIIAEEAVLEDVLGPLLLASTLNGAKKSFYIDKNHQVLDAGHSAHSSERHPSPPVFIGSELPLWLGGIGFVANIFPVPSDAWKFHSINYYTTYLYYDLLKDRYNLSNNPMRVGNSSLSSAMNSLGSSLKVEMPSQTFCHDSKKQLELPKSIKFLLKEQYAPKGFSCTRKKGWTQWLNRDDPGGSGDYETLKSFIKEGKGVCANPTEIQCKTLGGRNWNSTGEVYHCQASTGGICKKSEQSDGKCLNYQVRFKCP